MGQFDAKQDVPFKRIAAFSSYLVLSCTEAKKKKKGARIFLLFQEERCVFSPPIPDLRNGNTKKFPNISWNQSITVIENIGVVRIQALTKEFPLRLCVLPVCPHRERCLSVFSAPGLSSIGFSKHSLLNAVISVSFFGFWFFF